MTKAQTRKSAEPAPEPDAENPADEKPADEQEQPSGDAGSEGDGSQENEGSDEAPSDEGTSKPVSLEDVPRGLPTLSEPPEQTFAPDPGEDPLHEGLTNTSFTEAAQLTPDHSIDDLIDGKGDEWVTLKQDVVQVFYFPDTKRPSEKLLYRKGQVVKRSELEAELAAQKAAQDTAEQSASQDESSK